MKFRFLTITIFSFLTFCSMSSAQTPAQYNNPILAGFYPDPSVCRVGDNYYLVNSTFSYFPGIPVFHSKDLVNWKQISSVMSTPKHLDLDGLGVSEGIFAPAISYHNGLFYVTCTVVGGKGNFICTAKDPAGEWSLPVWLPEVNGIDPSLFFDDNGKAYIVYNSDAPDNKPLYDGHRTIRMFEFDLKNLKVTRENKILVNGGTDISKKPIWIEGPHIYKENGYYYLMAAEGGTGNDHSEVVFRSKTVDGPYIPYENNPILTQRNLDPDRKNAITSTGHADLVQTEGGDWWAVFLGCRPYEDDFYNTGRETFLAPVKWIDGWPVIIPKNEEVKYSYPLPTTSAKSEADIPKSGNFKIRDDFKGKQLKNNWLFLRTPKDNWYSLQDKKGFLSLQPRPKTCSEKVNPSFLGHRQQHLYGQASTSLQFQPGAENEKAGLLVFQNEAHYYFLAKSLEGNNPVIQLLKSSDEGKHEVLATRKLSGNSSKPIELRVEAKGNTYSFFYAEKPNEWQILKDNVDAKFLSTKVAGGFVGCIYALYATSSGQKSSNKAFYDSFEYEGKDPVLK